MKNTKASRLILMDDREFRRRASEVSRKVILDKSFLQAESKDCRMLHALRQCGCTFVIIDTLVYEYGDGKRKGMVNEVLDKLAAFADSIEVWQHTGELLKHELRSKQPVASPVDRCSTDRMRALLRGSETINPDDTSYVNAVREAKAQREQTAKALFDMCDVLCTGIFAKQCETARREVGKGPKSRLTMCDWVNDCANLITILGLSYGNRCRKDTYLREARSGLGRDWFAYHHSRAVLAMLFIYNMRNMHNADGAIERWNEFCNAVFDADYALLLLYADAIATNETRRDMTKLCLCLHPNGKRVFSKKDLSSVLPSSADVECDAYYKCNHRGRGDGRALDDWLSAERELMEKAWNLLGSRIGR